MIRIFAFVAALICAAPAIAQPLPANLDKQNALVIDTSKGRIVGMARRGDSVDTANSQFFFMFADAPSLNGQYTVIGEVVSGMDVIDKLKKAPAGSSSGSVADPDKMVKVQVASDIK